MSTTAFPIDSFRPWNPSRPKSIPRPRASHAHPHKTPFPVRSSPAFPSPHHVPVSPGSLDGRQSNQRHSLPARPPAEVCVYGNSQSGIRQDARSGFREEPVSTTSESNGISFSVPDKSPADSAIRATTSPRAQTPSGSPASDRSRLHDAITTDTSIGSQCSIQGAGGCHPVSESPESSVRPSPVPDEPTSLPIDPIILGDEFMLESSQLCQNIDDGDDIWSRQEETACPYPEPPMLSQSIFDNDHLPFGLIDENRPATCLHGNEHTRETSLDNSAESHGSLLQRSEQQHCSIDINRAGQRKRPLTGTVEDRRRPSKRQRLDATSSLPAGDSCASLRDHFISLPTNARLEFLSWLFEAALPRCTFEPEIAASITPAKRKLNTGVRKQVRWATPQGNAGSLDNSGSREKSRKGLPWLPEEESLLLELRNTRGLPWSDVMRLFSDQYPGRSQGSIQVYWSTKLKGRQS